jgi:hypothetical protein
MVLALAVVVAAWAGEAEVEADEDAPRPDVILRVGAGGGACTLGPASRLEVAVERWLGPKMALGGRVHFGYDGPIIEVFSDSMKRERFGAEPYVQVASTDARPRSVLQGGVGLAAARAYTPSPEPSSWGPLPGSWGPYRPVPTASLAVGFSSRHAKVVTLVRAETDGQANALWWGLQVGGNTTKL